MDTPRVCVTNHTTPRHESFRALVQQAEALHGELATLDDATRIRDDIKARISECQDEDEARKLLADYRQAEEDVTVKGIRKPRLQADLLAKLTEAEKASCAAHSDQARLLAEIGRGAASSFDGILQVIQDGDARARIQRANEDTVQALRVPWLVERTLGTIQSARCSIGMEDYRTPDQRLETLRTALRILDKGLSRCAELTNEAEHFGSACSAFLKAYSKR